MGEKEIGKIIQHDGHLTMYRQFSRGRFKSTGCVLVRLFLCGPLFFVDMVIKGKSCCFLPKRFTVKAILWSIGK